MSPSRSRRGRSWRGCRRYCGASQRTARPSEKETLGFDDLEIDGVSREVRVSGQVVALTPKEFDLLYTDGVEPTNRVHAIGAARGALGSCLRGRPLHRDRSHQASSREDRARSVEAAPSRDGVGRRLPVRAMSRARLPALVAGVVLAGCAGKPCARRRAWREGKRASRPRTALADRPGRHGGGDRRGAPAAWRTPPFAGDSWRSRRSPFS